MAGLDPRGQVNRALLVGVSEYDNTRPPHGVPGDLPAVKHNLNALREALRRGGVFEEREITLSRSPDQVAFDQALLTAAAEAEGVLLLYFSGHGAIPSAGDELFLQLRNASVVAGAEAVFPGAAMFSTVLAMLASSPARRIVVVLDCCFAGNAAWIWDRFEDRRRVLLLMSVQANHRIDAGDADTPTPFTEEMVRLLREGAARGREVTFQRLVDELPRRLAARGHRTLRGAPWEPQSHTEAGEDVLLVAGRGGDDDGTSEPPPRPGPWDRVRAAFAAVAGVLAGAVSGVLKALLRRLRGQGGAPPDRPGGASPDHPPGASADRSGGASPDHPSGGPRFVRRLLAWCAVLLAVAVLGVGAYRLVPDLIDGPASCAPPLELRVLTDPDLEPTLRAAADAYLTSEENTTGDGCRRSGITVYSAGAADTVTALRRQSGAWQEPRDEGTNPQRDVGPQPDVWIPGSRAEVARVVAGQDTDAVAELEAAEKPLAYSPVVLAVPQALAVEDLDERVGPSLNRMIDTLRSRHREAEVRRPDPEFTVTGLLATVGLHAPGPDAGNSPVPDHAGAERRVAQSGPPSPTAADLLCALPDDDAADNRTAALVPEFLLRSGVGCDATRRTPRMAQYPGDVPGLEPVFVRVRWQGADRDAAGRDDAAGRFAAWLSGDGGEAVFARDGFRSAGGSRPLLDTEEVAEGVLRAPSPLTEPAGRDAMEAALTGYQGANGPGRVLFLLDSSGSMGALWEGPSGGPGLVRQSFAGLGEEDEYGVWAVHGTGEDTYDTLLPVGRHTRADAERTVDRTARVRDAEADPRGALLAAFDHMERRGAADQRPDLIVFVTDDEDADRLTGEGLDDVLDLARAARIPVTAVSLTGGGCDAGEPDARISEASGGRCLDTDDDLGAALQDEVARTGTGEQ